MLRRANSPAFILGLKEIGGCFELARAMMGTTGLEKSLTIRRGVVRLGVVVEGEQATGRKSEETCRQHTFYNQQIL